MRLKIIPFLLILSLIITGCTMNTNSEVKSDATFNVNKTTGNYNENIINSINETGYDVLSYLNNENNGKNILFSPLSLTTALSMLENGAKEETKEEILNFLNLGTDENVNETYNQLINHFYKISDNKNVEDRKTTVINMANSFWFRNYDLKIRKDYINEIQRNYFESEKVQIIKLDYSDAAMYVFLPKGNINDFINNNDSMKLNELIKNMEYNKVDLSFPKFKFTNNNDLVDLLKDLGIKSAFDYKLANFDYMIESENEVAITKVFQNTTIEVDEKGTEAAAVTVIATKESAALVMNEPVIMNCNKPFLFIIKDKASNTDLFSGILRNPNEKWFKLK